MGLDITAYTRLVPVPGAVSLDDDGYPEDWGSRFFVHERTIALTEKHWPGHTEGVLAGRFYDYADAFRFRAGSYGGYNHWRDGLARLAGHATAREAWNKPAIGPFAELIHFSDCEGVIGPVVSAKLARDFAHYAARAEERAAAMGDIEGGYWLDSYRDWRKAFEMAADGGAVDFH